MLLWQGPLFLSLNKHWAFTSLLSGHLWTLESKAALSWLPLRAHPDPRITCSSVRESGYRLLGPGKLVLATTNGSIFRLNIGQTWVLPPPQCLPIRVYMLRVVLDPHCLCQWTSTIDSHSVVKITHSGPLLLTSFRETTLVQDKCLLYLVQDSVLPCYTRITVQSVLSMRGSCYVLQRSQLYQGFKHFQSEFWLQ